METNLTIKVIRSGQPRPYAATERVTQVSGTMTPYEGAETRVLDGSLLEQAALQVTACIPFGPNKMLPYKDDEREWHQSYIDYCTITDNVCEVRIVTPFTD